MRAFKSFDDVLSCLGQEVAKSEWVSMSQERIDRFAQATEDHQWIHTDPVQAAKGPFKTTIAHGFLSLSLIPKLFESSVSLEMCKMGINYGLNRVRFTDVVPVGSRIMASFLLSSAERLSEPDGLQSTWDVTLKREGSDKPVCVAQCVFRHYA